MSGLKKCPKDSVKHLKILPEYFNAVSCGKKTFELRQNDRNYHPGDTLVLQEWSPTTGYTGRELVRSVPYILYGGKFGLGEGWCILAIQEGEPE